MDNQILSGILAEYAALRQQNQQEEARRLNEIREKHPTIAELVNKRHDMILNSVRGAFGSGLSPDPEGEMTAYNKKIAAALSENGYPADYLAPVCRCAMCGDTGYIYENSVRKFCACLEENYRRALSRTGQAASAEQTFDSYDAARIPDTPLPGAGITQREYMEAVRQKCQLYAANVPAGPVKTLLLHGGSGLGKTFLLNCVGSDARRRGVETVYVTAYDLLNDLKNAYFSRGGESAQAYFDAPLLLIDDLGMEPLMENVTVEQIYNLLNTRLVRGLYTGVSTNLTRVELKQRYTERFTSRLLDARTGLDVPLQGQDIRLVKG